MDLQSNYRASLTLMGMSDRHFVGVLRAMADDIAALQRENRDQAIELAEMREELKKAQLFTNFAFWLASAAIGLCLGSIWGAK